MSIAHYFRCFSEPTRWRILHLLRQGPLCVCHLQEILDEPQAKISKQLAYLKPYGLVTARRHHNWTIYSLPPHLPAEVEAMLDLPLDEADQKTLTADRLRRDALLRRLVETSEAPEPIGVLLARGEIGCC
ncbi:MAG: metalloregulator ArsR/SmtB family transcription factor [Verrucomicrobiota bacterium JB022]|nr:metalloregulator ArsR/SmtB family transcription factor [Verrucomicrobiota bacterium JB022]